MGRFFNRALQFILMHWTNVFLTVTECLPQSRVLGTVSVKISPQYDNNQRLTTLGSSGHYIRDKSNSFCFISALGEKLLKLINNEKKPAIFLREQQFGNIDIQATIIP